MFPLVTGVSPFTTAAPLTDNEAVKNEKCNIRIYFKLPG